MRHNFITQALFLAVFFFCSIPAFSASSGSTPLSEAESEKVIAGINEACAGIKSLQADFQQVKELSMLNEKMVSKGKMYFQNGMLRWEYVYPYSYLFIMNRQKVLLQTDRSKNTMNVASNRMFQMIAKIMMESLTGSALSGKDDFKVQMFSDNGKYVAELVPLRKELKQLYKSLRLYFGKDLKVSGIELVESGGNTVITISNAQYNKAVDEKYFAVD